MDQEELCANPPIDRFAWQYSFYAYLVYRQAPARGRALADLSQVLHVWKGHLSPIEVADAVLRTWPFDVTD